LGWMVRWASVFWRVVRRRDLEHVDVKELNCFLYLVVFACLGTGLREVLEQWWQAYVALMMQQMPPGRLIQRPGQP